MSTKILALAAVVTASEFDDIVARVNAADAGWVAAAPHHRFGDLSDVAKVCGTWTKGHANYVDMKLPRHQADLSPLPPAAIPSDFDARTNWPKCSIISKIRDQSACGSCWAFGSTEAFEDSRCAMTGEDKEFSTEDTAGCCSGLACGMSQGCNGGQPSAALSWMTKTGVVSGGDYPDAQNATGGCKAYALAPCAHHVPPSPQYPACPTKEYSIKCSKVCDSGSNVTYADDKTKGVKASSLSSVAGMQTAIMTGGPLAVAFEVYADFPTYRSGVYRHLTGSSLGGHAVEMIGWGVLNGTDYWLIKNSWNEQWGDGGTFKILRGKDECGIEDDVTAISFQ